MIIISKNDVVKLDDELLNIEGGFPVYFRFMCKKSDLDSVEILEKMMKQNNKIVFLNDDLKHLTDRFYTIDGLHHRQNSKIPNLFEFTMDLNIEMESD